MDNVLCDYQRNIALAHLADLTGRPAAFIDEQLFASGFDDECDRSRVDVDGIVADISNILGTELNAAQLMEARARSMEPDPQVLELAAKLKSRTEISLLSQNGVMLFEALPQIFPEVLPIFEDRIFFSYQFGAIKTEAALYENVLSHIGATAAATLFIDDDADFVACANDAGLQTHRFIDAAGLADELKERGLLQET